MPSAPTSSHRGMSKAGGVATILVLALFPLQMSVFALAWPAPQTAVAYFELLERNPVVGLLSLDVLMMADWLLVLVVWSALFAALRAAAPIRMALTLAIVIAATAMYFASNTAFGMLSLSNDYAVANSDAERATLVAAGERALATFDGPWFVASYVAAGLAAILASTAMRAVPAFGNATAWIGVIYGAMQLVPPNLGAVGMAVSLASLLPMLAWLALVARGFFRLARAGPPPAARAASAPS